MTGAHLKPAGQSEDDILLRASKVIAAAVAHSLATVEEQVSVPGLRVLVMIGDQGSLNLSGVAEGLGVNASSASRTCDRLVRAGLLDRRDDDLDRRQVSLSLTRKGHRFVQGVMKERLAVLGRVVDAMAPRARKSLLSGLTSFVETAESLGEDGQFNDGTGGLFRWVV